MTRDEFKKRLETLGEVIFRGLVCYSVLKKLRFHDGESVEWTLEQQREMQGRFKGFFKPVSLALTDVALLQFAKAFEPNSKTASLTHLLSAARKDGRLTPRLAQDELVQISNEIDKSKELLAKLKRLRDQQLAHAASQSPPVEELRLGDLDSLAESMLSWFNRLSSGHDGNITSLSFALRTSEQETDAVLRILIESEERRKLEHEETMVQIGVDQLERAEMNHGETLDKETMGHVIGTLGLTEEQMQRAAERYSTGLNGRET